MGLRDIFRRSPEASRGKPPEKSAEAGIVFEDVKPGDEIAEREGRIAGLESRLAEIDKTGGAYRETELDMRNQLAELSYQNATERIFMDNLRMFKVGETVRTMGAKAGEEWKVVAYDEAGDRYTLGEEGTGSIKHVNGKELVAWQESVGRLAYETKSRARRALEDFRAGEQGRAYRLAAEQARPAAQFDNEGNPPPPTTAATEKLYSNLGINRKRTTDSGREIEIPR